MRWAAPSKVPDAVAVGDAAFFHALLPRRETWPLYPEFAEQALFPDIDQGFANSSWITAAAAWANTASPASLG